MSFDGAKLKAQLIIHEARRNRSYLDSKGIVTVGIGHNVSAKPITLTDAQVDDLYVGDVNEKLAELDSQLPWWRTLDDVRARVLIDMAFNMGVGVLGGTAGLCGFHTFLAAVKNGYWVQAGQAMQASTWWNEVGTRSKTLQAMILTGRDVLPV